MKKNIHRTTMGTIHCRITRRKGLSGTEQMDCLRATIASKEDTDNRQMGEDSMHASSFNNIDMSAAIEALSTYLGNYLSTGKTVHLDGIGSFQLSIGLKEMLPADAKVTARNVEVKGITFRPSEKFMAKLKKDVRFVIDEDHRDVATDLDVILERLRQHMAACRENGRPELISIKRLAALTASSYNTAHNKMGQLVSEGYLIPSTDERSLYLPGPNLQD